MGTLRLIDKSPAELVVILKKARELTCDSEHGRATYSFVKPIGAELCYCMTGGMLAASGVMVQHRTTDPHFGVNDHYELIGDIVKVLGFKESTLLYTFNDTQSNKEIRKHFTARIKHYQDKGRQR